jgi:hypothetical protein
MLRQVRLTDGQMQIDGSHSDPMQVRTTRDADPVG